MQQVSAIRTAPPTTLMGAVLLVGLACGCRPGSESAPSEQTAAVRPYPVRLIVVDDPPLADIVRRQWQARIENELTLSEMTLDELENVRQLNADAIIYPSACVGMLAERGLISEPSAEVLRDGRYAAGDVFDVQRRVEVSWGESVMAFSFGSPQLVLFYRADLLEALQAELPGDWPGLAELAGRLTRASLGDAIASADGPWYPLVQPMAEGWGAQVLLARAAAYATHPSQFSVLFDYTTMEPLIAGPPFVRALSELVACHPFGPENGASWTPEAARRAVLEGQAAMAFTWPSRAAGARAQANIIEQARFGFAELPGAGEAYNFAERTWTPRDAEARSVPLLAVSGRLGSVTRNARRPREVAGILALLTSGDWSSEIAPQSAATTLFRRSHLRLPNMWTDAGLLTEASQQYAEVVERTQSRAVYLFSPRIPGWRTYLAALDDAVNQACQGAATPAEALAAAVEAWNAITDSLGREAQQIAYTRSLGLEP